MKKKPNTTASRKSAAARKQVRLDAAEAARAAEALEESIRVADTKTAEAERLAKAGDATNAAVAAADAAAKVKEAGTWFSRLKAACGW